MSTHTHSVFSCITLQQSAMPSGFVLPYFPMICFTSVRVVEVTCCRPIYTLLVTLFIRRSPSQILHNISRINLILEKSIGFFFRFWSRGNWRPSHKKQARIQISSTEFNEGMGDAIATPLYVKATVDYAQFRTP